MPGLTILQISRKYCRAGPDRGQNDLAIGAGG